MPVPETSLVSRSMVAVFWLPSVSWSLMPRWATPAAVWGRPKRMVSAMEPVVWLTLSALFSWVETAAADGSQVVQREPTMARLSRPEMTRFVYFNAVNLPLNVVLTQLHPAGPPGSAYARTETAGLSPVSSVP